MLLSRSLGIEAQCTIMLYDTPTNPYTQWGRVHQVRQQEHHTRDMCTILGKGGEDDDTARSFSMVM